MKEFIAHALKSCQNSHPKVRYSAFHLIGQCSEDMRPTYQENFFNETFPILCEGFKDEVDRCLSHAIAAMTNFLEGCASDQV